MFRLKRRVTSVVLSVFAIKVFGVVALMMSEYGVNVLPSKLVKTWYDVTHSPLYGWPDVMTPDNVLVSKKSI